MQKFDLFIPLGSFCATSYHLRQAGLQAESLPFDWVSPVNLNVAVKLLKNHFENFLILEELKFIKHENFHSVLCNQYGIKFYHDFSSENILDDFPAVREKYNRRINRLYGKIKSSKSILFIHLDHGQGEPDITFILKMWKDLLELFPHKRIKILFIHLIDGKKGFEYVYKSSKVDVVKMEFATNPDPADDWKGNSEVFNQFYTKYRLAYRSFFVRKINALQYKMIKLFCCLIPSKKIRKQLREKYKRIKFSE